MILNNTIKKQDNNFHSKVGRNKNYGNTKVAQETTMETRISHSKIKAKKQHLEMESKLTITEKGL